MPAGVPDGVSKAFASLIPAIIIAFDDSDQWLFSRFSYRLAWFVVKTI